MKGEACAALSARKRCVAGESSRILMKRRTLLSTACMLAAGISVPRLSVADKYTGPRPPKKDILYLVLGERLVETEVVTAKQSTSKEGAVYSVPGAASTARTPLAEPIFLLASDQIAPESLGLYRFEVRNGNREITLSGKRGKFASKQYHLSVRNLEPGLNRIEASDPLDEGEYTISPEGSNTSFCFTVY
jgi:hypothetical protein